MQQLAIFSAALFFCLTLPATPQRLEACLPSQIKLTDIVSAEIIESTAAGNLIKKVTVKEILTALKARCRKGKLVDGSGREIYFYRLTGCWGNAPADYEDILERQRKEIERLKKRYTVVEMTCNPSGILIQ